MNSQIALLDDEPSEVWPSMCDEDFDERNYNMPVEVKPIQMQTLDSNREDRLELDGVI